MLKEPQRPKIIISSVPDAIKDSRINTEAGAPIQPYRTTLFSSKNRWVKIKYKKKTAYAQWEDVGPFNTNDFAYVFGKRKPLNKENESAGIDISPAVRDYLEMSNMAKVSWQFVDHEDVPDGPWKQIVTTRQITWK